MSVNVTADTAAYSEKWGALIAEAMSKNPPPEGFRGPVILGGDGEDEGGSSHPYVAIVAYDEGVIRGVVVFTPGGIPVMLEALMEMGSHFLSRALEENDTDLGPMSMEQMLEALNG